MVWGGRREEGSGWGMTIGIIPIGYADGFFREFSNGVGRVSVRGRKVPIIGKICMDMCMIKWEFVFALVERRNLCLLR